MSVPFRAAPRQNSTSASTDITGQTGSIPPARGVLSASGDQQELVAAIADRVIEALGGYWQSLVAAHDRADDGLVFVICSFTPEMEPVYLAIAEASRAIGLHAERVEDIQGDYRPSPVAGDRPGAADEGGLRGQRAGSPARRPRP